MLHTKQRIQLDGVHNSQMLSFHFPCMYNTKRHSTLADVCTLTPTCFHQKDYASWHTPETWFYYTYYSAESWNKTLKQNLTSHFLNQLPKLHVNSDGNKSDGNAPLTIPHTSSPFWIPLSWYLNHQGWEMSEMRLLCMPHKHLLPYKKKGILLKRSQLLFFFFLSRNFTFQSPSAQIILLKFLTYTLTSPRWMT